MIRTRFKPSHKCTRTEFGYDYRNILRRSLYGVSMIVVEVPLSDLDVTIQACSLLPSSACSTIRATSGCARAVVRAMCIRGQHSQSECSVVYATSVPRDEKSSCNPGVHFHLINGFATSQMKHLDWFQRTHSIPLRTNLRPWYISWSLIRTYDRRTKPKIGFEPLKHSSLNLRHRLYLWLERGLSIRTLEDRILSTGL